MTPAEVADRFGAKRSGDGWLACCPAHEDRTPSLSIGAGKDGGTVLYCHAGCPTDDVLAAVGLQMLDLAPPRTEPRSAEVAARYPYHDAEGTLLYTVMRTNPKGFHQVPANGKRGPGAMAGVPLVLYRLPAVIAAVKAGESVFIAEGEKDADALTAAGVCGTTAAQGAGKWHKTDTHAVLAGARVIVVADKDKPGYRHAADIERSLRGIAAEVIVVEAAEGKDAADHIGAGHRSADFKKILDRNPPDGTAPILDLDTLAGNTPDAADDDIEDDAGEDAQRPSRLIERLLRPADLRSIAPPQPLIRGLLDLDSTAQLIGRRGSYKSFLALDWALCVAYGQRWHGKSVQYGPVIYACAEGVHGLAQRIDAWKKHHNITADTDRLLVLPEGVNLLSLSASGELADTAKETGARLVILDTFARCIVGGDENSAKDMGIALEQIDVIRRRSGACVLSVHHFGKGGSDKGARGHSVIEAALDTIYELTADDGRVTLKNTKQKHHPEGTPWHLKVTPTGDSVVLDLGRGGEGIPDRVLDTLAALDAVAVPGGVASGVWKAAAGESDPTFYRNLKGLLTLSLVSNLGTDQRPRYQVSEAGTLALSSHSHRLQ